MTLAGLVQIALYGRVSGDDPETTGQNDEIQILHLDDDTAFIGPFFLNVYCAIWNVI